MQIRSWGTCRGPASNIFKTATSLRQAVDRLDKLSRPLDQADYLSLLKASTLFKFLSCAKRIHAHLSHHHISLTGFLGENLLVTLSKCGALQDALHIFHTFPCRTVFSWTAIISGFTDSGRPLDAIRMYQRMLADGVEPDSYTFVTLSKACGNLCDLHQAKQLHLEASQKGYASQVFVGNAIISMYGKCHALTEAELVFAELSRRDVVSWNAMISVYGDQEQGAKALLLYRQMCEEGSNLPDEHTLVFALQAVCIFAEQGEVDSTCQKALALEIGAALHAEARRKRFCSNNFVGNTLISMYGKCGRVAEAVNAFNNLLEPDIVSRTALLSVLLEQGQPVTVLQMHGELSMEQIGNNHQTFLVALQACGNLAENEEASMLKDGRLSKERSLEIGQAVHVDARTLGLDNSLFVGNTLLSMYGKCGAIAESEKVFVSLSERDIVSWNAMLTAYVGQGQAVQALKIYRQMHKEGFRSNRRTLMAVLQACDDLAGIEDGYLADGTVLYSYLFEIGQALHADVRRAGLASDMYLGTNLIRIYGKCGAIPQAENAFCKLPQVDIVSSTAMLLAFIEHGEEESAFSLYKHMQEENMTLDDVSIVCLLQACYKTKRIDFGRQLHFIIVASGVESNPFLGSALINTYGSSSRIIDASAVFDGFPSADVGMWNSYIASFAGKESSLLMFDVMQLEGFNPNAVTYASLLSACSHAGLVAEGIEYFVSASRDYGLDKDVNHYVVMVDLLGRAGDFVRVENFMRRVPKQADLSTGLCLLGSCGTHGNVQLANSAFEHLVNLQTRDPVPVAYVTMSNICAATGLLDVSET